MKWLNDRLGFKGKWQLMPRNFGRSLKMPVCTPPQVNQAVYYAENGYWYDAVVTGVYPGTNNADLTVYVDGGNPFTRTNRQNSASMANNKWSCVGISIPEAWIRLSDVNAKQPA